MYFYLYVKRLWLIVKLFKIIELNLCYYEIDMENNMNVLFLVKFYISVIIKII